jgi:hypothetical protein
VELIVTQRHSILCVYERLPMIPSDLARSYQCDRKRACSLAHALEENRCREKLFSKSLRSCYLAFMMTFRIILLSACLCGMQTAALGAENMPTNGDRSDGAAKPWVRKIAFGILLHDVGFISDQKEHGADPNWELQFNRPEWNWWRWVGSPSVMLGATPNFNGYTSAFYLGLAWEASLSNAWFDHLTNDFSKRLWISGGLSTAVHTGPLRNDESLSREKSDCGFGSRVLPRIQLELA